MWLTIPEGRTDECPGHEHAHSKPSGDRGCHAPCAEASQPCGVTLGIVGRARPGSSERICGDGDLPSIGDYPNATAISDITVSGSIKLIKSFNSGRDLAGKPIEQSTSFLVGCAFNLAASDMDKELKALDRKVSAGADFVLTQPVYEPEYVEQARQRLGGFPVPVLLGVLPLRSHRHAEFLHNEVPGMVIPEELRARMREAGDDGANVGIEMAQSMLNSVRNDISGIYFMPPFGRYDSVIKVMDGVITDTALFAP